MTYNDITQHLDNGLTTDLVFFDFSKAFDRVNHATMLSKLLDLGINRQLVSWIEKFLTLRTMSVRVSDAFSSPVQVTSGVPQGSVLGPLLFLIYINHAVNSISCNFKIFADDIKFYLSLPHNNNEVYCEALQSDIDCLVQAGASWGLEMNVNKCVCMRFGNSQNSPSHLSQSPYSISNATIKFVHSHPDLGVLIDRELKFHGHVRRVVGVASGLSVNILGSTVCKDRDFLLNIYKSLIRPHLEYASCVWNVGYIGDLRLIESVQRRWTRSISDLSELSYGERLNRLDLFSMKGCLLRSDLIAVWKIFHNLSALQPQSLFVMETTHRTRGHSFKIHVPRSRLDLRKHFFSVRVIETWNRLSSETVEAETLGCFKSLLRRDLGQSLFDYYD